jgi:predicted DNA-binding transcriptional regulator AlpA
VTLLRAEDVERILGVAPGWAYKNQGDLPTIRMGKGRGFLRWQREDVDAYIASRRRDPLPKQEPETPTVPRPAGRRRTQ